MKTNHKPFVRRLFQSELIRNSSILISGTILAQLISILLQPFLRRFFSPESFGIFSVYLSIIGILLVITSFRYDAAIVLPENDNESVNILALSLILSLILNVILFIIAAIWGDQIIHLLNLPKKFSPKILFIIPISVLLYNTYQCFNYWLIRKKRFMAVSSNKIVRRGTEGLAQIIFVITQNFRGLIYGDIIGQSSNVITVIVMAFRNGFRFQNISLGSLRYVFRKYSEFPRTNLIPAFMSACSYLLPTIFITKYYSVEYSAYFDLSKLLLSLPLALIATSFSNVLLQKISEKYQKKESIRNDLMPVFLITSLIGLLEILIILVFGILLFGFVFGETWSFSGEISKILVWSFVFSFFVSTFSSIFISMRKIKIYSIWQLFYFIAILSLFFFKDLMFIDFIKLYVIIEVLCYIAILITMFAILAKYEISISKTEFTKIKIVKSLFLRYRH